jgi:uncharacterized protein (TIGR00369 family)
MVQQRAVCRVELSKAHHNNLGMTHSGALVILAGFAFAAATNNHRRVAVSIDAHITYAKTSHTGTHPASAQEQSCDYRTGTCEVRLTDDGGQVATCHGTAYRKREQLPDLPDISQGKASALGSPASRSAVHIDGGEAIEAGAPALRLPHNAQARSATPASAPCKATAVDIRNAFSSLQPFCEPHASEKPTCRRPRPAVSSGRASAACD